MRASVNDAPKLRSASDLKKKWTTLKSDAIKYDGEKMKTGEWEQEKGIIKMCEHPVG